VKVYRDTELIGFFILRIRDKKLIVPYFYCKYDIGSLQRAVEVIGHHIIDLKIVELTTQMVLRVCPRSSYFLESDDSNQTVLFFEEN